MHRTPSKILATKLATYKDNKHIYAILTRKNFAVLMLTGSYISDNQCWTGT